MRVTVVFVYVATKPEYNSGHKRWLESYLKHESGYPHKLVQIDRYDDDYVNRGYWHKDGAFQVIKHLRYDGGGWDVGSWQFAGRNIDTDLLVCFNSNTWITGDNWLLRFVKAVTAARENGTDYAYGLWGPLASYEVTPHIRTPCMIFQPSVINYYPRQVETREDTYRFECLGWPDGTPTFTQWVQQQGLVTQLVTWDGAYDMRDWRKSDNIFRRGDQSNLIVKDHHAEAYEISDANEKARLEQLANGL